MKAFLKNNRLISVSLGIILLMGLINLISWKSVSFCNFYVANIFPPIVNVFSRITSIFKFSVGEIMIILAVLIVIISPILYIILIITKKGKRKAVTLGFTRFFLVIFAFISTVMTLNCFVLYRCTRLSDKNIAESDDSLDELVTAYSAVVEKLNELYPQVSRDDSGYFVLTDDLNSTAKKSMLTLSDELPQLSGFYPRLKPIRNSFFMSQQQISGIYYPFSLEANYNKDIMDINLPSVGCHELAHLKGFIQEDEANFIAFLACIRSESIDFQYSGYMSAYEYLLNHLWEYECVNTLEMNGVIPTAEHGVCIDSYCFLYPEYWEENEHKEIIPTETIAEIAHAANDTSLKLNGVEDGTISYSRVARLIIKYYNSEINW